MKQRYYETDEEYEERINRINERLNILSTFQRVDIKEMINFFDSDQFYANTEIYFKNYFEEALNDEFVFYIFEGSSKKGVYEVFEKKFYPAEELKKLDDKYYDEDKMTFDDSYCVTKEYFYSLDLCSFFNFQNTWYLSITVEELIFYLEEILQTIESMWRVV
ncbi:MAG: hypothetical protein AABZ74_18375 [Cyanobacteriota bacterium]